MPKVSLIIPVYNVQDYIEKCLDSVVNQTIDDIEIIIVNDGSKDKSKQKIENYLEKYPKIKYLEKENGGLSDARNYGLKFATGEYVAFLDSDDYVEKNTYEEMYNLAKKEKSDMVECDFIWEYPNKIREDIGVLYSSKKEMIEKARVVAWNKLIKRNLIVENNLEFPKGLRYEDVEFTYKLIPHIKKYTYVDEILLHYVQRENSIANVQNERTAEIFEILDNVEKYYKQNNLYNEYKDAMEYNYARYLLCSSLKRITKIPNKEKRKELLEKSWESLNKKYPAWKKNKILNNNKSGKNIYMKTVNDVTFKLYSKLFQII